MQCKVGFGLRQCNRFRNLSLILLKSVSNKPILLNSYSLRGGSLDAVFATRIDGSEDLNHILVWSQPLVLGVHKGKTRFSKKEIYLC